MAKNQIDGEKYLKLRDVLVAGFGSCKKFSEKSGIAQSTVIMVLKGRRSHDRKANRKRIEDALKSLLPGQDLSGIWEKKAKLLRGMRVRKELLRQGIRNNL